jgi:biofilm PGA synthesis N-glycosyltransferase PgaC
MLTVFFWICAALIFYTYLGYPLALYLVSRFFTRKVQKQAGTPTVSVILSAFNEERNIERKLLNLLNLDYPEEKIEILVGSDGAIDQTDAIVSKFRSPRVRFFRFVTNRGKPTVLNDLVREAQGSILVFTDARQDFERDAVKMLVENFNDPKVGCVSGEMCFEEGGAEAIGRGMNAYWEYEKFLRKKEAEIGSMLGATGAIYAARRHLYSDMPADMLVDDMYVPLSIVNKGYRAVFESRARAYDRVSTRGKEEFKRKVRTLAGNYQIFQVFPGLFNPFKSPIAFQLFSHKFLRLAVPFFLAGLFISNILLLHDLFYRFIFIAQVVFYGMAMMEALNDKLEHVRERRGLRRKIGYIAYTFCLLNYAAVVALAQFLRGKQKITWEKAYA